MAATQGLLRGVGHDSGRQNPATPESKTSLTGFSMKIEPRREEFTHNKYGNIGVMHRKSIAFDERMEIDAGPKGLISQKGSDIGEFGSPTSQIRKQRGRSDTLIPLPSSG